MIGPRTRVLAVGRHHRWKTSCCGIEPIMIVTAADSQNSQPCSVASGKKLNISLAEACAEHLVAPAGQVGGEPGDQRQADDDDQHLHEVGQRTDHMPPNTV